MRTPLSPDTNSSASASLRRSKTFVGPRFSFAGRGGGAGIEGAAGRGGGGGGGGEEDGKAKRRALRTISSKKNQT